MRNIVGSFVEVKDQTVAVVQSIHHTPDELLFEYLLLADALK